MQQNWEEITRTGLKKNTQHPGEFETACSFYTTFEGRKHKLWCQKCKFWPIRSPHSPNPLSGMNRLLTHTHHGTKGSNPNLFSKSRLDADNNLNQNMHLFTRQIKIKQNTENRSESRAHWAMENVFVHPFFGSSEGTQSDPTNSLVPSVETST